MGGGLRGQGLAGCANGPKVYCVKKKRKKKGWAMQQNSDNIVAAAAGTEKDRRSAPGIQ